MGIELFGRNTNHSLLYKRLPAAGGRKKGTVHSKEKEGDGAFKNQAQDVGGREYRGAAWAAIPRGNVREKGGGGGV